MSACTWNQHPLIGSSTRIWCCHVRNRAPDSVSTWAPTCLPTLCLCGGWVRWTSKSIALWWTHSLASLTYVATLYVGHVCSVWHHAEQLTSPRTLQPSNQPRRRCQPVLLLCLLCCHSKRTPSNTPSSHFVRDYHASMRFQSTGTVDARRVVVAVLRGPSRDRHCVSSASSVSTTKHSRERSRERSKDGKPKPHRKAPPIDRPRLSFLQPTESSRRRKAEIEETTQKVGCLAATLVRAAV